MSFHFNKTSDPADFMMFYFVDFFVRFCLFNTVQLSVVTFGCIIAIQKFVIKQPGIKTGVAIEEVEYELVQ